MEYALEIGDGPNTIPGGTGLVLFRPSAGESDRIDTEFIATDTDSFLVISTRTTAREVEQKLDHYGVDRSKAVILDTLSVERGYSRRSGENVHYVSAPDDLDGILEHTRRFLESGSDKRRITVDSVSELSYYTEDENAVLDAMIEIHGLLGEHDAVGLFHVSPEIHEEHLLNQYRDQFDGQITVDEDGAVQVTL